MSDILKVIFKFLKITLCGILGLLAFLVFIYVARILYADIVKTFVPVASKDFLNRLPGTIILYDMLDQNCGKDQGCYAFESTSQGFQSEKLIDKTLKLPDNSFSGWETPKRKIVTSDDVYVKDEQGHLSRLTTEGRQIMLACWSPDNRYLLYNVEYRDLVNTLDADAYLYFIYDIQTKETYRLFKNPDIVGACYWTNNKIKLTEPHKFNNDKLRFYGLYY